MRLNGLVAAGLWLALAGAAGALGAPAEPARAAEAKRVEPVISDDGLHTQPWFLNSFLDLREDLAETKAAGKRLAIIWEQRGCPYCKETHEVNFAQADINDYVRRNFNVIQLNLWGDRPVTDFDGKVLPEKALARKWGILFTPTIMYFPETVAEVAGRSGKDAEIARMPGYFRPFHFLAMFRYVRESRYADTQFQKFLEEHREWMQKQGKDTKVW
jgi:thioredoxin-related protein